MATDEQRVRAAEVNWSDDESVVRAAIPSVYMSGFGFVCADTAKLGRYWIADTWKEARQNSVVQEFERTHRDTEPQEHIEIGGTGSADTGVIPSKRSHMADTPELPEMDVTEEDRERASARTDDREFGPWTQLTCRERQLREACATIAALRAPLTGPANSETFPEFWSGFGLRMVAVGETNEVIARTAWHAAKAGNEPAAQGDTVRLRGERDEWRRKYFEMERAQSRSIDRNGEHIKRIQFLEREKDEIRSALRNAEAKNG